LKQKLPLVLIAAGILIAAVSLLADFIGLGSPGGIPAMQVLGAEAGVVLALIGLGWRIRQQGGEALPSWRGATTWVGNQPVLTWVIVGFLVAYLLCFIAPAIYNPQYRFQYFTDYLHPREKIGFDARLILEHVGHWYLQDQTAKYLYPPLTTVLFTPLLLLRFPYNYYVVTVVTLLSFLVLNLLLPLRMGKKREVRALILFVFVLTAFSYGLQFELETGQFYTLAMLMTMLGAYIFHEHPRYRIFAYLFFCVSIQLKMMPAVFIFLFVDDWRDWKATLKRFIGLGLANILLLFLLGLPYLQLFLARLDGSKYNMEPLYNHSIKVFVLNLAQTGYGMLAGASLDWVRANVNGITLSLFAWYALCFAVTLFLAWKRNAHGVDASLLTVSLIGGLVLPTISHDYNLPLLALPFMLWTSGLHLPEKPWTRLLAIALLLLASFAFAVTLFPSNARPAPLENSLPALMVILTAVTAMEFLEKKVGF